jgi:hypothetical protein
MYECQRKQFIRQFNKIYKVHRAEITVRSEDPIRRRRE